MPAITSVTGREVLDSRGYPTVEVEIECAGGSGRAIVPSGASTGSHEAHELRDGDPQRYEARGVLGAVANVNGELARLVLGMDASDQAAIDRAMIDLDGTANKSRLGANAILGVSLAAAHAAAAAAGLPLYRYLNDGVPMTMPVPMVNIISGGLHAGRQLDFQDYLVIPVGAPSYREALRWATTIRFKALEILREEGRAVLLADEGGFGPELAGNEEAIGLVLRATERAGLRPGSDVFIGLDVASQHFYDGDRYELASEDRSLSAGEMSDWLADLAEHYPIVSMEDGMAEDDWHGWAEHTRRLGDRMQVLGDDLFTTNIGRLRRGIDGGIANAILIKINQIGTLTEAFETLATARQAGYRTIVSARSGETEDASVADIAVATAAGQIKIGSTARSSRLAKYNQLLRIEEALGDAAPYAGLEVFEGWLR
jgi:enolase